MARWPLTSSDSNMALSGCSGCDGILHRNHRSSWLNPDCLQYVPFTPQAFFLQVLCTDSNLHSLQIVQGELGAQALPSSQRALKEEERWDERGLLSPQEQLVPGEPILESLSSNVSMQSSEKLEGLSSHQSTGPPKAPAGTRWEKHPQIDVHPCNSSAQTNIQS